MDDTLYLRAVSRRDATGGGYPLDSDILSNLAELRFTAPVTVLSGENGSGKTTLMELLAAGARAVRVDASGSEKAAIFGKAARRFRFVMGARPRLSLFFQAEDFVRYLDALRAMLREAREALDEQALTYRGRSDYARAQAAMPHVRTMEETLSRYGGDMGERSHGEGFLDFFAARLLPGGLYLLDEPEGALSYANQLVMLSLIHSAAQNQCQLILSTHSPVLAACPGAALYELRGGEIRPARYDSLENVAFLRRFLSDRDRLLRMSGIGGTQDTESEMRD